MKEADDLIRWQVANFVDSRCGNLRPKVAGEDPKMEAAMGTVVNPAVTEWDDAACRMR